MKPTVHLLTILIAVACSALAGGAASIAVSETDRDAIIEVAHQHHLKDITAVQIYIDDRRKGHVLRAALAFGPPVRSNAALCRRYALRVTDEGHGWAVTRNEDFRILGRLWEESTSCPDDFAYIDVGKIDDGTLAWLLQRLRDYRYRDADVSHLCAPEPTCSLPLEWIGALSVDCNRDQCRYEAYYDPPDRQFVLNVYVTRSVSDDQLQFIDSGVIEP